MARRVALSVVFVLLLLAPATAAVATPEPIPPELWSPSSVPDSPTHVVLESGSGDWVGGGGTYTYTPETAHIVVTSHGDRITVSVDGDEWWNGTFAGPDGDPLSESLYDDLTRHPFHDPAVGGLSWSGEGRGCNTLEGWFAVDELTLAPDGTLEALRLRFEQWCDSSAAPLNGQVAWDASAPEPEPVNPRPIPPDLWSPDPVDLPHASTIAYLESTPGDWVGQGASYAYPSATGDVAVALVDGRIHVDVDGDDWWDGDFAPPDGHDLTTGWYGDLQRYPFHNPALGGLSWSGNGRGCNTLDGWFAIDEFAVDGGEITRLVLRFQQHCTSEEEPPLNGYVEVGRPLTDTTPPETAITSGPDHRGKDQTATFTFEADEPATFECRLDGGSWSSCTSPTTLADLTYGDHVLAVRATDGAGNVDATPATWAWSIKGGKPGTR